MPDITAGNIQFPLSGRIGVIVYIAVGDVAPKLELRDVGLKEFNGRLTPAATFHNSGKGHGRPEGVLEGKDASGKSFEFVVSPFPILPGETRAVAIWAQEGPDKKTPVIAYPAAPARHQSSGTAASRASTPPSPRAASRPDLRKRDVGHHVAAQRHVGDERAAVVERPRQRQRRLGSGCAARGCRA